MALVLQWQLGCAVAGSDVPEANQLPQQLKPACLLLLKHDCERPTSGCPRA